ncbi:pyridoxamine 5'-phosphate oxidase family protein [Rhodomicrobium lacus]|uniref:pyridoxamine 5'-phosphate oxidase family protein n=1 Tax=Rhodomicrobium lacus TaxID=2498452 RepID=UPI0026E1D1CD|nr:pyridoxamine 5'-phosphate oxidase family protein [Rhodomicrobium lacus]WKW49682.1 pyridoxamine 5'-phosphate oxidase family protein [Rhodomicrobium lacus]
MSDEASETWPVGPLNRIRRGDRADYDRDAVNAVLDEGLTAHVGFVDGDRPVVVPMFYGRIHDTLYLHGSNGTRIVKKLGKGAPVCLTVTLLDGLVVARSAFHMSANFRSVVLHGRADLVTDASEASRALAAITDHAFPGRWGEVRPMLEKELRATAVLRVTVEAASLKHRNAPPKDDEADMALPIWAGVVSLDTRATAATDETCPQDVPLPPSVEAMLKRRGAGL